MAEFVTRSKDISSKNDKNTMELDLQSAIEDGLKSILPMLTDGKIIEPKDEQSEALVNLFSGKDTVCILRTGFGKTMIFMVLVPLYQLVQALTPHSLKSVEKPLVIVISPLLSLMASQVLDAKQYGIEAAQMPSEEDTNDCDMLFGSPEFWTGQKGMSVLKAQAHRVITLVTDEVHVVPKWGMADGKKTAFRSSYGDLKKLRSFLLRVPILALTATASKTTRLRFQRSLGLKSPHVIIRTPDRPNICLCVQKIKDVDCFQFLVNSLKAEGVNHPRTLIYCKSIKDITELFMFFDKSLGDKGYVDSEEKSQLFAMYFHNTLDSRKEEIRKDLFNTDGHFRVVICSSALGMGVDMPKVCSVYHYGVPKDMEDYLQEFGRAGRSGEDAHAKLFYRPVHMLGCSQAMRDYVKNSTTCRRKLVLQYFTDDEPQFPQIKHTCCDNCAAECNCDEHEIEPVIEETDELKKLRIIDSDQRDLMQELLLDLKATIGNQKFVFGVPVWPEGLENEVIKQSEYIQDVEHAADLLPIICPYLLMEVCAIVFNVADENFEYQRNFIDDIRMYSVPYEQFSIIDKVDWESESEHEDDFADALDEELFESDGYVSEN